ncbi:MAG: hypothetical protein ACRDKB_09085 [Actinomycetota bacterium]
MSGRERRSRERGKPSPSSLASRPKFTRRGLLRVVRAELARARSELFRAREMNRLLKEEHARRRRRLEGLE